MARRAFSATIVRLNITYDFVPHRRVPRTLVRLYKPWERFSCLIVIKISKFGVGGGRVHEWF